MPSHFNRQKLAAISVEDIGAIRLIILNATTVAFEDLMTDFLVFSQTFEQSLRTVDLGLITVQVSYRAIIGSPLVQTVPGK